MSICIACGKEILREDKVRSLAGIVWQFVHEDHFKDEVDQ